MRNRVRQHRLENGWTVAEVARRAGVTSSFIYKIETGAKLPSLDVAIRLAKALRTRVEAIFLPDDCTEGTDDAR